MFTIFFQLADLAVCVGCELDVYSTTWLTLRTHPPFTVIYYNTSGCSLYMYNIDYADLGDERAARSKSTVAQHIS